MSRASFVFAVAAVAVALSVPSIARAEGSSAATAADPSTGTPTGTPTTPPPLPPSTAASPAGTSSTAPASSATPAAAPSDKPNGEAAGKKNEDEDHSVYVSISPFHLLLPVVEGTAEIKLHRKIGVAGIFGAGSMKSGGYKFKVWEVGGQFVGYPVGHFDNGMQLGVELLYANVSTSDSIDQNTSISGVGSGVSVGPMIGYKLATKIGFSFNIQGGAAAVVARAEATDGNSKAKIEQSTILPILNLNIGWSF